MDFLNGIAIPGRLQLLAREMAEGFLVGLHRSPFHGFSVEFAEHRLYNPGDSLRYIDWKVFARKDKLFVKKYEEETNLRCCIAVDISASMYYPEQGTNKLQYACLAAATIMELLKRQQDAASLALFDHQITYISEAHSGGSHIRQLTHEMEKVMAQAPARGTTNVAAALDELAERLRRRTLVIVFTDAPEDISNRQSLFTALEHLRYTRHEVILFNVVDKKKEVDFDFEDRPYEFVDMESGSLLKLNPAAVKDIYTSQMNTYRKRLKEHCLALNIDFVEADIAAPLTEVLHRYLLKRNKMM